MTHAAEGQRQDLAVGAVPFLLDDVLGVAERGEDGGVGGDLPWARHADAVAVMMPASQSTRVP